MKSKPVAEYEATGEIERVYHELRQCLRVPGVNLNFRTWAGFGKFLPAMWDGMRPNILTPAFTRAADSLRNSAETAAGSFRGAAIGAALPAGEGNAFQVRAALALYHYINPKLLVLTSAVRMALEGEAIGAPGHSEPMERAGEPEKMFAMEMEAEKPDDERLGALFEDIKKTLKLAQINSDYRTLGLWPEYLATAWAWLKPVCQSEPFQQAANRLRNEARDLARTLPHRFTLTQQDVDELGEDGAQVLKTTRQFEQLLPVLILNIAALRHQALASGAIAPQRRPIRSGKGWRAFQERQRTIEVGPNFITYAEEGQGDPVVLLHGIPSWSYLWEGTMRALSPKYRVLAPDLLGFGYSDKRDGFDRSIARQAEVIDAWMEKMGLSQAHIVAHDIGGGVALRLATLFPNRVRSLCVMNGVCYDSWPIEMMLQMGHPAARQKMSASTVQRVLSVALKMGFASKPEADWMEGLLSPWRTEVGKLSLIRNAAALNTNLTTEITRLLPRIEVPTLILWGEEDRFQLVHYGERLARDIPRAVFQRIADARHFVMIDQPVEVHRALRRHLGNVATAQPALHVSAPASGTPRARRPRSF